MYDCGDRTYRPGNMSVFEFVIGGEYAVECPREISQERWNAMLTWYANRIKEGSTNYEIYITMGT
jgi:hypothetical protein